MSKANRAGPLYFWLAVGLLGYFWFSRTHNLLILPLFLDEASHLTRAQWVWEGKPLYLLETGKALAPYLAALFHPYTGAPFIGRYVVILLGAIGLAAAYGVGKVFHSPAVGLLTMVLWCASPQLFFFERMALVDTTISAMAMLCLWFMCWAIRGGRIGPALAAGICVALVAVAKLTGLVFAPIPLLCAVLLPSKLAWKKRLRAAFAAYIASAIILGPMLWYILSQQADPTGQSTGLTSLAGGSMVTRALRNIGLIFDMERAYLGDGMIVVLFVGASLALILAPRRALILIMLSGGLIGAISVAATYLWLRYSVPALPFWWLLLALGIGQGVNLITGKGKSTPRIYRRYAVAVGGMIALWIGFFALPFQWQAYRDPAGLALSERDYGEYIRWIPSGFGIREAADLLRDKPGITVGTAVNCQSLRLYVEAFGPAANRVLCPDLDWGGRRYQPAVAAFEAALASGQPVYWLTEGKRPPTVPVNMVPRERFIMGQFDRPKGNFYVRIYLLTR
jgi:hypothetical protein